MTRIVMIDVEELRSIVADAVREASEDRPSEPFEWLDTKGAAEVLGVAPRTVAKLAKDGELPRTRIGEKLYRFRREDLLAYLERGRV